MKKYYVIVLALIFSGKLLGEEVLNEPFSTWLPEGWSVIEGPGSVYYSHWFHKDEETATVFVTGDDQDEWLITPELTLPSVGELRLSVDMMGAPWRMITMDYGDFFVNVSTDDGATWETIWVEDDQEIVEASGVDWPWQHNEWFYPSINLNDYAGETIKIGFRYVSPDGEADWWNLDNVIVKSLVDNEVVLEEFEFPVYGMVNDEFYFEGSFRNLGENDVTSFEVTYTVNDIESEIYLVENVSIPYNTTYDFTHDIPYTFEDPEIFHLDLIITKINGEDDPIPGNNVISRDISIATEIVDRKPLFEIFTSSTCGPCVAGNETIAAVLANIPDTTYSLVKYQVDWPGDGDPYYIEDNGIRVDYYEVGGVPSMITNGYELFSPYEFNQVKFNQATDEDAYIEMDLNYTFDGLNVAATVEIDPRINIADASVHFVVVEKTTYNNTGTNGETEFHNVVMAMIPDGYGTSTELSIGTIASFTGNKNLITTFVEEFDDLMIVSWVQDNYTHSILQSESSDLDISIGMSDIPRKSISVYPNPSNDKFNIDSVLNSSIEVTNVRGQLIIHQSGLKNLHTIDLSGFENGIYFLRIINENGEITNRKLLLN